MMEMTQLSLTWFDIKRILRSTLSQSSKRNLKKRTKRNLTRRHFESMRSFQLQPPQNLAQLHPLGNLMDQEADTEVEEVDLVVAEEEEADLKTDLKVELNLMKVDQSISTMIAPFRR